MALVLFDAPIGTADRILPLSERPPIPGTPVMVGGYAQENPNVLTADKSCQVIGYNANARGRLLTRHNCRATRGVSGAPLWRSRVPRLSTGRAQAKAGCISHRVC